MSAVADKPIVAAFDFDGTLTRRDTMMPFLYHVAGALRFAWQLLLIAPTLAGYATRLIRNDLAKQRVFMRCLGGMRMETLQHAGEDFAGHVLPGLLREAALRRLDWHKRQGHRCVLISASLDLYIRPWALQAGFDEVIATHLETLPDGTTSGRLHGANCFGAEKSRRLAALLGPREGYVLHAYGDSRGDRELLAMADYAYYRNFPDY